MAAKTMDEEKFCQECNQKHTCRQAFQQLGRMGGPSVVYKTIVAFLLPLIVFIFSLAILEKKLPNVIHIKKLQTLIAFLLASLATFVFVLIIRYFGLVRDGLRHKRNRQQQYK
jgi:phosphoglycerol transferase MdoB-like AlkP superfamily enzyme